MMDKPVTRCDRNEKSILARDSQSRPSLPSTLFPVASRDWIPKKMLRGTGDVLPCQQVPQRLVRVGKHPCHKNVASGVSFLERGTASPTLEVFAGEHHWPFCMPSQSGRRLVATNVGGSHVSSEVSPQPVLNPESGKTRQDSSGIPISHRGVSRQGPAPFNLPKPLQTCPTGHSCRPWVRPIGDTRSHARIPPADPITTTGRASAIPESSHFSMITGKPEDRIEVKTWIA